MTFSPLQIADDENARREAEYAHLAKTAERIVTDILELAHLIDNDGWSLAYAMAIRSDRHLSYARAVKTVGQLANLRVF